MFSSPCMLQANQCVFDRTQERWEVFARSRRVKWIRRSFRECCSDWGTTASAPVLLVASPEPSPLFSSEERPLQNARFRYILSPYVPFHYTILVGAVAASSFLSCDAPSYRLFLTFSPRCALGGGIPTSIGRSRCVRSQSVVKKHRMTTRSVR